MGNRIIDEISDAAQRAEAMRPARAEICISQELPVDGGTPDEVIQLEVPAGNGGCSGEAERIFIISEEAFESMKEELLAQTAIPIYAPGCVRLNPEGPPAWPQSSS